MAKRGKAKAEEPKKKTCRGKTKAGSPCKRTVAETLDFCPSHAGKEPNSTNSTTRPPDWPIWANGFLERVRKGFTTTEAAKSVGQHRSTPHALKVRDGAFAEAWADAEESVTDQLEQALLDRAINGWEEPVYQGGMMVGTKLKFDNVLGWNMLKTRRPNPYGDKEEDPKDRSRPVEIIFAPFAPPSEPKK